MAIEKDGRGESGRTPSVREGGVLMLLLFRLVSLRERGRRGNEGDDLEGAFDVGGKVRGGKEVEESDLTRVVVEGGIKLWGGHALTETRVLFWRIGGVDRRDITLQEGSC